MNAELFAKIATQLDPMRTAVAVKDSTVYAINEILGKVAPRLVKATGLPARGVATGIIAGLVDITIQSVAAVVGVPAEKFDEFFHNAGQKIMDALDQACVDVGCDPLNGEHSLVQLPEEPAAPRLPHFIMAEHYNDFRRCCNELGIRPSEAAYLVNTNDIRGKRIDVAVATPNYRQNRAYDQAFFDTLDHCCGKQIAESHYDIATRNYKPGTHAPASAA